MKQLLYTAVILSLMTAVACSNNKKTENKVKEPKEVELDQIAQNDYFRIQYPSFYEVYDDIRYPTLTEVAQWEKERPDEDTIPSTAINEFYLVPKFDNPGLMNPEIYIVLSRFKIQLPIRDFAQTSIAMKDMTPAEDGLTYIGYTDIDSLTFAGYPALSYGLFYESATGDTIVQQQIVVQREDYSLFYINNKYNKKSKASWELGAKMLETFEFEPLVRDSI